eukprot:365569-Chlamydomonas_euryale.AAC.2
MPWEQQRQPENQYGRKIQPPGCANQRAGAGCISAPHARVRTRENDSQPEEPKAPHPDEPKAPHPDEPKAPHPDELNAPAH